MLFFAAVICFAFCSTQPVYVCLALAGAAAYYIFLKGFKQFGKLLLFFIPFSLLIVFINSAFNYAGATRLWRLGPLFFNLEGCLFGLAMGGMFMAVVTWFASYTEVMTEDKFTYLFGKVAPTISLVISMISRWVPRMASRGRNFFDAQESLVGAYDTTRAGAVKRGSRLATVLAGLGMEDSICISDSMRARGYGSRGRTSYASYSWHTRETVVLCVLVVLVLVNAVGMALQNAAFSYYPRVSPIEFWWGYVTYALLLLVPFLLEFEALFHLGGAREAAAALSPSVTRVIEAEGAGLARAAHTVQTFKRIEAPLAERGVQQ